MAGFDGFSGSGGDSIYSGGGGALGTGFQPNFTPSLAQPTSFLEGLQSYLPSLEQFGQGATALSGIAGAYGDFTNANTNKNFAEDSLALSNRNLESNSILANQDSMDRAHMAAQLNGFKVGTPEYDAYVAANSAQVDGSPV